MSILPVVASSVKSADRTSKFVLTGGSTVALAGYNVGPAVGPLRPETTNAYADPSMFASNLTGLVAFGTVAGEEHERMSAFVTVPSAVVSAGELHAEEIVPPLG